MCIRDRYDGNISTYNLIGYAYYVQAKHINLLYSICCNKRAGLADITNIYVIFYTDDDACDDEYDEYGEYAVLC